jgi:chorismate-pyruvate lyase
MMPIDMHPMPDIILKRRDFGNLMLERIADLEARSGTRLGLAQKILLAETGTVEQVLSILTNSTVRVKVVDQKENIENITRQSLIMSDRGKVLIKARSRVFKRNLPINVLSQIKRKESGIGTIIASSGLETFRKIVEVGYDPANRSVFRKYQIIVRKKVAFEIKEEIVGLESGPGGI